MMGRGCPWPSVDGVCDQKVLETVKTAVLPQSKGLTQVSVLVRSTQARENPKPAYVVAMPTL